MAVIEEEVRSLFQGVLKKAKKISSKAYQLLFNLMRDHVDKDFPDASTKPVQTSLPFTSTSTTSRASTTTAATTTVTVSYDYSHKATATMGWHETTCSKLYSEAYCYNSGTCVQIMHTAEDTTISLACRCPLNFYGSRCQYYSSHLNAIQETSNASDVYRDLGIAMLVILIFAFVAVLLYILYRRKLLCRQLYKADATIFTPCTTPALQSRFYNTGFSIASVSSSVSKTSFSNVSLTASELRRRNRESRDLEQFANLENFLNSTSATEVPCKTPFMHCVSINPSSTGSISSQKLFEEARFCFENQCWQPEPETS